MACRKGNENQDISKTLHVCFSVEHSLSVIKLVIMEHLLYCVLQILLLVQCLQLVIMSCRQNTSRWLEKVEDIQVHVNNAVVTEF